MLREFAHFHPNVSRTIQYVSLMHILFSISEFESRKATEVTRWPFSVHDPLPKWSQGKVLLIGDAAHPVSVPPYHTSDFADIEKMLPYGGQGSNQAIEDAGALGFLLNKVETGEDLGEKLALFDKVRRKRASRAQILGKVMIGKEQNVRESYCSMLIHRALVNLPHLHVYKQMLMLL